MSKSKRIVKAAPYKRSTKVALLIALNARIDELKKIMVANAKEMRHLQAAHKSLS